MPIPRSRRTIARRLFISGTIAVVALVGGWYLLTTLIYSTTLYATKRAAHLVRTSRSDLDNIVHIFESYDCVLKLSGDGIYALSLSGDSAVTLPTTWRPGSGQSDSDPKHQSCLDDANSVVVASLQRAEFFLKRNGIGAGRDHCGEALPGHISIYIGGNSNALGGSSVFLVWSPNGLVSWFPSPVTTASSWDWCRPKEPARVMWMHVVDDWYIITEW